MKRALNFLKRMLTDVNGGVSSKRFITFSAFVLLCIAFIANVFMEIPLQEFIWNGMIYLVGAGLGFSTVEHFAKK